MPYSPIIGAIIGQVLVGLVCDRIGRKVALVSTTLLIIIGATIGTAAHGANGSVQGLFWCLTFARGITGVVCPITLCPFVKNHMVDLSFRASVGNTLLPPRVQAKLPTRKWLGSVDQVR